MKRKLVICGALALAAVIGLVALLVVGRGNDTAETRAMPAQKSTDNVATPAAALIRQEVVKAVVSRDHVLEAMDEVLKHRDPCVPSESRLSEAGRQAYAEWKEQVGAMEVFARDGFVYAKDNGYTNLSADALETMSNNGDGRAALTLARRELMRLKKWAELHEPNGHDPAKHEAFEEEVARVSGLLRRAYTAGGFAMAMYDTAALHTMAHHHYADYNKDEGAAPGHEAPYQDHLKHAMEWYGMAELAMPGIPSMADARLSLFTAERLQADAQMKERIGILFDAMERRRETVFGGKPAIAPVPTEIRSMMTNNCPFVPGNPTGATAWIDLVPDNHREPEMAKLYHRVDLPASP